MKLLDFEGLIVQGTGCSPTGMPSMRQGVFVLKPTCFRGSETSQTPWGAVGLFASGQLIPGLHGSPGKKWGCSTYREAFYFRWSLVFQDQLSDLG